MQASAYPSSTTRYGISREPAEALRTVLRGSVGSMCSILHPNIREFPFQVLR